MNVVSNKMIKTFEKKYICVRINYLGGKMIKIIVDSTAYIPKEFIEENDIAVVPLRVLYLDKEFEEGLPGSFDEFFASFTKTKIFPKTSQPSPEAFIAAYNKVIDEGNEAIVFTISASLSGTNSVANLSRESCKDPSKITVMDSKSTGQNIWGYCMEVIEKAKEGWSRVQIVEYIETLQVNSQICFVPDSLDYLKNGGRIGKVSAVLGSLLQIKPILTFKQGTLLCAKKVFGVAKAITELITMIPKNVKRLFAIHIANTKYFDMLHEKMKESFPDATIYEGELGPVVAAHIGPAIGVCYIC